jgi:hypothetical protein
MKFLLNDKDFDSVRADIPNSNRSFELLKTDEDEYSLIEHGGDNVDGLLVLTKVEWRILWQMLTIER